MHRKEWCQFGQRLGLQFGLQVAAAAVTQRVTASLEREAVAAQLRLGARAAALGGRRGSILAQLQPPLCGHAREQRIVGGGGLRCLEVNAAIARAGCAWRLAGKERSKFQLPESRCGPRRHGVPCGPGNHAAGSKFASCPLVCSCQACEYAVRHALPWAVASPALARKLRSWISCSEPVASSASVTPCGAPSTLPRSVPRRSASMASRPCSRCLREPLARSGRGRAGGAGPGRAVPTSASPRRGRPAAKARARSPRSDLCFVAFPDAFALP